MKIDIHDAVVMAVIVIILGALFSAWTGIRMIQQSQAVAYYRLQRKQGATGTWTIVFAWVLIGLALLLIFFAEPIAYRYFPPSPTVSSTPTLSLTPTVSLTSTISMTPTISQTPAESYAPTIMDTPFLPIAVEIQFVGVMTPDPKAVFSPLVFSRSVQGYQPINPQTDFKNPIETIIATYTYDYMSDGVQWTALWYRDGQLINFETAPWEAHTGGYGKFQMVLRAEEWLPGIYQLIFFVGEEWKVHGEFHVIGNPPTATPTFMQPLTPAETQAPQPTK
jgi:hypothetical protein